MNIAERLEQMMQNKGMNRRQLSIAAGIPYTTLDGISKRGCDNVYQNVLDHEKIKVARTLNAQY